jgi:uncharacterized protein (UPF0335 family)
LGRDNGLAVLPQILKMRPNLPVVMFSAQSTVKKAVQAIHLGAVDFLEKPFTREQFHAVIARVQKFSQMGKQIERLEQEVKETQASTPSRSSTFDTPSMSKVMEVLKRSAKSDASVLILGESGTGKSVAARALHENSHLADKPLVTVSCPTLSKGAAREHPLRPRARRLHRRPQGLLGQGEGRRRRHALPRRDRRPCRSRSSRSSCASSRSANTSGWGRPSPARPTSGSSPRPTAI